MLKRYRPVTSSMRGLVLEKNETLTSNASNPLKSLSRGKKRINGRNNAGRITCRHRGGGHKRKYREIDFERNKFDIPGKVVGIEYDPNRGSHIALINYADGEKRYILACQDGPKRPLKVGDQIKAYTSKSQLPEKKTDLVRVGNAMVLDLIPEGTSIHNVSIRPNSRGVLAKGAGTSARVVAKEKINGVPYVSVAFPSGEIKKLHGQCHATVGVTSNADRRLRVEAKAGRNRWKGFRPTVRGMAMNPVDHPMGGGNGKSKGKGMRSPWGLAKGVKTRSPKKSMKMIVAARKRKK